MTSTPAPIRVLEREWWVVCELSECGAGGMSVSECGVGGVSVSECGKVGVSVSERWLCDVSVRVSESAIVKVSGWEREGGSTIACCARLFLGSRRASLGGRGGATCERLQ